MKASFYTLGCRLNQAETAIIAKTFKNAGYTIVEFGEKADLTVINTCTVTEQADAKCRKAVRKSISQNPETFVAVVGCYAQMAVDVISKIEGVDLIAGNQHKLKLNQYIKSLKKRDKPLIIHSQKIDRAAFSIDTPGLYDNTTRANLKIQDGCNFVCSFCIIPKARGPARSREFGDIIREARELVAMGHQELVLTGINIGTYQNGSKYIIDVLNDLEKIDGLKRIRISSIEPTTIPGALIYKIAESDKLCKHLHIPLQSGDDKILRVMRRKYSVSEFVKFVEFVDKVVPDAGIGTDVMVGYPTEGSEEFINTKKVLADLPVSYFHVFTYSDRPGTASVKIKDKVDPQEKKRRTKILIEQGLRKKHAYYEKHLGKKQHVLFENRNNDGNWMGYTSNYMRVEAESDLDLHNKIKTIRFNALKNGSITGVLTNE